MIRQVEESDLEEVRSMVARSIRISVAGTAEDAQFLIADVWAGLDAWKQNGTDAMHLLHETAGLVTGSILVKKYWNLCDLFVDPAHQRRGVGRALLDAVVPTCRQRSPRNKLLVNSSTVGIPFYKAYGFVQTGPGIERPGGCVPLELAFSPAG